MQIITTAGEFSEELEAFACSFNFGVERANCRCFISGFFFLSFSSFRFFQLNLLNRIPLTATVLILKRGKCEPLIALRPAAPAICWILTSTRPRLVHFIIFISFFILYFILFYFIAEKTLHVKPEHVRICGRAHKSPNVQSPTQHSPSYSNLIYQSAGVIIP